MIAVDQAVVAGQDVDCPMPERCRSRPDPEGRKNRAMGEAADGKDDAPLRHGREFDGDEPPAGGRFRSRWPVARGRAAYRVGDPAGDHTAMPGFRRGGNHDSRVGESGLKQGAGMVAGKRPAGRVRAPESGG